MGNEVSSSLVALRDGFTSLQFNNLSFSFSSLAVAAGALLSISFVKKCYKAHQVRKALQNLHNKPHPIFGHLREAKMADLGNNGEKAVPISSYVSLATLDIILRCAFSYEGNIQEQGKRDPYISSVMQITESLLRRVTNPLLQNAILFHLSPTGWKHRKAVNYVHKVAERVIQNRKKALLESPGTPKKRYLDFLDILLAAHDEDGQGLTDQEIRNEVDTFLFAGHDTTASSISWVLYELARHPEIQAKVREELMEIIDGRDDNKIGWEDLAKMHYFTKCIKEGMRVHPPVPIIGRQMSKDLEIGGCTIPKDTSVSVNIYALHHNPSVWGEDHMEYKPERFDPDEIVKRDAYDYVPFSAGPRNCIGQHFAMNEQKVTIGQVLMRFEIRVDPNHKVEEHPETVTRATNDIKLFFKPLKN